MTRAEAEGGAAEIGVLGAGRMGLRLAAMFARAGRRVILGSRDPRRSESLADHLAIPTLHGSSYERAVEAGAVLPAVFMRDGLFDVLEALRPQLVGKLVIDISNPFNDDYSDYLTPWNTSAAEELQRNFPEAHVVGAFKNVYWEVFDAPVFGGRLSDVFVVGDDDGAKSEFLDLAAGTPFRYLDAGPLQNARAIERLTPITGRLGRALGAYPRMNWCLLTHEG